MLHHRGPAILITDCSISLNCQFVDMSFQAQQHDLKFGTRVN